MALVADIGLRFAVVVDGEEFGGEVHNPLVSDVLASVRALGYYVEAFAAGVKVEPAALEISAKLSDADRETLRRIGEELQRA